MYKSINVWGFYVYKICILFYHVQLYVILIKLKEEKYKNQSLFQDSELIKMPTQYLISSTKVYNKKFHISHTKHVCVIFLCTINTNLRNYAEKIS